MANDYKNKILKLRELLRNRQIDGIMINTAQNFSWLTGGRGFISLASEKSCSQILVTKNKVYIITNNIDAQRIKKEELDGLEAEFVTFPWHDEGKRNELMKEIMPQGQIEDDLTLANEFKNLRLIMTEDELSNYWWLGRAAAKATEKIAREIKVGCTEYDVWGMLTSEALKNGMEPATVLVGFDQRIFDYRHPVATGNILEKYAMLVTGFRKWGLIVSCTRFVSFEKLDQTMLSRFSAVANVDAALILSTRPGAKVSNIFKNALEVYKLTGYTDEWQNHHQGGLTGYDGRELVANETTKNIVQLNQVYAWNPSIAGTKCEDTIIIGSEHNEIITHTGEYEYIEAEYNGTKILRPQALIRVKGY